MADLTGLPNLVAGDVLEPIEGALIREYEAEAAITKGQAVYLSSDGKVSPATSAQNCIGIAIKDATVGEMCSVIVRGRVKVEAGGAIARGQAVYGGDASARVLALADQAVDEGGTATYTIYYSRAFAYAEQAATAAGDLISILVVK
jgi:hypothetical protein